MVVAALLDFLEAIEKRSGHPDSLIDVTEKSHELLFRNASSLDAIFERYDLEKYTILHAALLRAKFASLLGTKPAQLLLDKELLITQTETFFQRCNVEHARRVMLHVKFISKQFTSLLIAESMAVRGINTLLDTIRKMQLCPEQLTAFHGDLCQLALSAKIFKPVLSVLDTVALEIDRYRSAFDATDYLLYFYYGGMIYALLKNWERSVHFFELCLLIPAVTFNRILLEAVKKLIVVSLLHSGNFTLIANARSPLYTTMKHHHSLCQPYLDLVPAFRSNNPADLRILIEHQEAVYREDCNLGLMKQLLAYHVKFRIQNLTKTFMTMSLVDLATRVKLSSPQEAERYLVEMIDDRKIFAHIDQQDGTVHFLDDPQHYNSAEMLKRLQEKVDECVALEKRVMRMTDQLVTSPSHVKRMLKLEGKPIS